MRPFVVRPVSCLKGTVIPSGDKSIAHRAVILSSLSPGVTTIDNFPVNNDCFFTISACKKLGIAIRIASRKNASAILRVFGKGLNGLSCPRASVCVGDSGTTFRLFLGVLAGQPFLTRLTSGYSLSKRPMRRVAAPLRAMGAEVVAVTRARANDEYPPLTVRGGGLVGMRYRMPVASAQVKSAILLAGLYARGTTVVIEPVPTRDHTERMLRLFKARVTISKRTISIAGGKALVSPGRIYVPGDISSAGFFLVAAALVPHSRVVIKNVGLNPTRIGIIRVLKRMGADIKIQKITAKNFEPIGNITVKSSALKGVRIRRKEIPSLIDELPVLMVAASRALGRTILEGVEELRVKETDRIKSMSEGLKKMGADIRIITSGKSENIIIKGTKNLQGAKVGSFGDHRTAMSMVVAGLAAKGVTRIDGISCINKSFPNFLRIMKKLAKYK